MDNPEKLATSGTQDEDKQNKTKPQHSMCWTPLFTNKLLNYILNIYQKLI
jgi:hypothetical protein